MIDNLKSRHLDYIQSEYHIRNPRLIEERHLLLNDEDAKTNAMATPFLEAPPRYGVGKKKFAELNLPDEIKSTLTQFAEHNLEVFNPPYDHQAEGIEAFFSENKDVIVTTGTGSGKTEVFLYSILGQISQEAERNKTIHMNGVRALVLYPMNALVSDQLTRMRGMFGMRANPDDKRPDFDFKSPQELLKEKLGRPFRFAMYTGRTQYHGKYDPDKTVVVNGKKRRKKGKNSKRLQPILEWYRDAGRDQPELYAELQRLGRVPEKNLDEENGFWKKGQYTKNGIDPKFRTCPEDAEYLARHEMLDPVNRDVYGGGSPDLLITNYSMLEYMLLRPIEQPILQDTAEWLESDPENKLLLVMDEAHLYRGSAGAEVGLLLRRLLQRLGVEIDRVKFILTSASFSDDAAEGFASQLTGKDESDWHRQSAEPIRYEADETEGNQLQIEALISTPTTPKSYIDIEGIKNAFGWEEPPNSGLDSIEEASLYLGSQLVNTPLFKYMADNLEYPTSIGVLSQALFPNQSSEDAEAATLSLANLACFARVLSENRPTPILPTRLHLFFRGLPNQYICANHNCEDKRTESGNFLGRMYLEPKFSCKCNHRTFLLETCRDCGSAYFRAYTIRGDFENFIDDSGGIDSIQFWTEPSEEQGTEVHILPLIEGQKTRISEKIFFLDSLTGIAYRNEMDCKIKDHLIKCYIGSEHRNKKPRFDWDGFTFKDCPMCGVQVSESVRLRIQDLETKGEQPISNLTANLFKHQPEKIYKSEEESRSFPNKGRKILAFSDSRSKASGLASKIQNEIEQDSIREAVFKVINEQFSWKEGGVSYSDIYVGLIWYCAQRNLRFFQDKRSRVPFIKTTSHLQDEIWDQKLHGQTLDQNKFSFVEGLVGVIPWDYTASLLRIVGDRYRSIYKLMLGILDVEVDELILEAMEEKGVDRKTTRATILNIVKNAAEGRAIDKSLKKDQRDLSRFWAEKESYPEGIEHNAVKGLPLFSSQLVNSLTSIGWGDDQFQELADQLLRPNMNIPNPIFQELDPSVDSTWEKQQVSQGRFHLNPSRIMLRPCLEISQWNHCVNCLNYSHSELLIGQQCPNCGSDDINECSSDDLHVQSRTGFYRNNILKQRSNIDEHPISLRAEEHTAQVNDKNAGEVWSTAEKYELEFQDVLISNDASELGRDQPVDLLSCTTTMEVGIDIGSLTAVAMRTVPPRPDNYQQRAGRAGRRGSSLSTIISFANNSPHEQYIFQNPEQIIYWQDSNDPTLQIDNRRIAERHVNALFIQRFFTIIAPPDPDSQSTVFESIGYTYDFFRSDIDLDHNYKKFKQWILEAKNDPDEVKRVAKLLPQELRRRVDPESKNPDWDCDFVSMRIETFVQELDDHCKVQDKNAQIFYQAKDEAEAANKKPPELGSEDTLLNFLLRNGFLPSFSFPLDVARFNIFRQSKSGVNVETEFTPSMGLRQALGAYVPGRTLYINKKKYQSGGLFYPFAPSKENRFEHINSDDQEHVMLCRSCNALHRFAKEEVAPSMHKCENCKFQDDQTVLPMIVPTDFAPPSKWHESKAALRKQDHLKFQQSNVLLPVSDGFKVKGDKFSPVSELITEEDRLFYQLNLGPETDDEPAKGWQFCGSCGTCIDTLAGNQSSGHLRPYPGIGFGPDGFSGAKCSSSNVDTLALGYKFKTDMMLIRVRLDENQIPPDCWEEAPIKDAAQSLSEALIRAITESKLVDIEPSELDGHNRILYNQGNDENETYLDFYIFDNTPGGSGHSVRVSQNLNDIFYEIQGILNCEAECDRSCHQCLRTYENRFHQRNLDRHWANSLHNYIMTGKVGEISRQRLEKMRDNILIPGLNAKLSEHDLGPCNFSEIDDETGIFTISNIAGKDLTFHIRSPISAENDDAEISLTDYDLMRNMPRVIKQIEDKVQG